MQSFPQSVVDDRKEAIREFGVEELEAALMRIGDPEEPSYRWTVAVALVDDRVQQKSRKRSIIGVKRRLRGEEVVEGQTPAKRELKEGEGGGLDALEALVEKKESALGAIVAKERAKDAGTRKKTTIESFRGVKRKEMEKALKAKASKERSNVIRK